MFHLLGLDRGLEGEIRLSQCLVYVANVDLDSRDDVVCGIALAEIYVVRLVVNDWCVVAGGLIDCQDRGEHFVVHVDQAKRFFRDLRRVGGYSRDTIPNIAHFIVEAHIVEWPRNGVGLSRR